MTSRETVCGCFAERRSLAQCLLVTLMSAVLLSRLEYRVPTFSELRAVIWGNWGKFSQHIQSVGIIFGVNRYSSISPGPLLKSLRWLPRNARIEQRLAVLAFRCQQGYTPNYPRDSQTPVFSLPGFLVSDLHQHQLSTSRQFAQESEEDVSELLLLMCGMIYRVQSPTRTTSTLLNGLY